MRTRSTRLQPQLITAAILLAAFVTLPGHAQSQGQQRGGTPMGNMQGYPTSPNSRLPMDSGTGVGEPDPLRDKMEAARAKGLRDDRHKKLESDADKLLALATELKSEVDKTSKDELSVDVVKKAGEMEKLAHDLKERMRN